MDGTDLYQVAPAKKNFRSLTFHLIGWVLRQGNDVLLKLATAVTTYRGNLPESEAVILEIKHALFPSPGPAPAFALGLEWRVPAPLAVLIEGYEKIAVGNHRITSLKDLVNNLRALPLDEYGLPDHLHLSDSAGERLAAVLALGKVPLPRYIRWLAERVVIERAYIGRLAAQALTCAALRLPRDELARIKAAAQDAGDLLDGTPTGAERVRELNLAQEVVDKRSKGVLDAFPGIEFDVLLVSLLEFDLTSLDDLCDQLGFKLNRIVSTDTPLECISYAVIRTAEQASWIGDLIEAIHERKPGDEEFARAYHEYLRATGGGKPEPI